MMRTTEPRWILGMGTTIDALDRAIINRLQDGVAVCEHPFEALRLELGMNEQDLLARLERLLATGVLSRLGPMFNVERMGGEFTLCAMAVPRERFDEVAREVNAFPEVAHNYQREHGYNMWFVLATSSSRDTDETLGTIEQRTGIEVLRLPKIEEFHVGLRFAV